MTRTGPDRVRRQMMQKQRVAPTFGRICVASKTGFVRPIVGAPHAPEVLPVYLARLRRTDIRPWMTT